VLVANKAKDTAVTIVFFNIRITVLLIGLRKKVYLKVLEKTMGIFPNFARWGLSRGEP
jgi:hypothetical protein